MQKFRANALRSLSPASVEALVQSADGLASASVETLTRALRRE
jgi:hypothetical protein